MWFQLIPLIIVLALMAFWMWMFSDMSRNQNLLASEKSEWTKAFIVLNIFAAINYYVNVYRKN